MHVNLQNGQQHSNFQEKSPVVFFLSVRIFPQIQQKPGEHQQYFQLIQNTILSIEFDFLPEQPMEDHKLQTTCTGCYSNLIASIPYSHKKLEAQDNINYN
jgi:hypothetical protein